MLSSLLGGRTSPDASFSFFTFLSLIFFLILFFFVRAKKKQENNMKRNASKRHTGIFFFAYVSFHFLRFFTFGQVKGNARYGRLRHPPTKVFKFVKLTLGP